MDSWLDQLATESGGVAEGQSGTVKITFYIPSNKPYESRGLLKLRVFGFFILFEDLKVIFFFSGLIQPFLSCINTK